MSHFLIVGLGNIGAAYAHTRHNIGFDIVDAYATQYGLSFEEHQYSLATHHTFKGHQLTLIKPTTYMNLSGEAVSYWLRKARIPLANMLVLVDDLALSLTELRLKKQGSAGGHNGLKNIEACLHTQLYTRLRFGLGSDFEKGRQVEFVLGKWKYEEQKLVQQKITYATEVIYLFCCTPLDTLISQVNAARFI